MARTDSLTNFLTDVSTAIKTKKGDNTPIKASNFDTEIANLPTGSGGVDISEYMNDGTTTTINSRSAGGWISFVKKLRPITKLPKNCANFFTGFSGRELDLSQVPSDTGFTHTSYMFQGTSLTDLDLSHFNFDNVIQANGMFSNSPFETLNLGSNTFPNNTAYNSMFDSTSVKQLPVNNFNYDKTTSLERYLYGCRQLEEDVIIEAPICTSFNSVIGYCTKMTTAKFSSDVVQKCSTLAVNATNLKTLDLSGMNMAKITGNSSGNLQNFVNYCTSLENLSFGTNYGSGFASSLSANNTYAVINLSTCSSLTKESVLDVFNKVADITGKNTQKIILHADVKAQLTDEEIAIATNKGWTVS